MQTCQRLSYFLPCRLLNAPPPTPMAGGQPRASLSPRLRQSPESCRKGGVRSPAGTGPPNLTSHTYLLQSSLPSSFVLQAHVQSSQLQPHGGHVEGVQRIVLTGRREETTGHLVNACREPTGRVQWAVVAQLVATLSTAARLLQTPAGAGGRAWMVQPCLPIVDALHFMQFVCFWKTT